MNTNAEPEPIRMSPDQPLIDQIYAGLVRDIFKRANAYIDPNEGLIPSQYTYEVRRAALFAHRAAEILANYEKPQ